MHTEIIGNDVGSALTGITSSDACKGKCQLLADCKFYMWEGATNTCFFKSANDRSAIVVGK